MSLSVVALVPCFLIFVQSIASFVVSGFHKTRHKVLPYLEVKGGRVRDSCCSKYGRKLQLMECNKDCFGYQITWNTVVGFWEVMQLGEGGGGNFHMLVNGDVPFLG